MRTGLIVVAALVVVGCVSGCLSPGQSATGKEFDASAVATLERGATPSQVSTLVGPPLDRRIYEDGTEIWIYARVEASGNYGRVYSDPSTKITAQVAYLCFRNGALVKEGRPVAAAEVEVKAKAAPEPKNREGKLAETMAYLYEIEGVRWVEVDGNDVAVGFDPLPDDWEMLVRAAAFHGNKAIDFGCHVWAVPATEKGKKTGYGKWYGTATARHGKVVKFTLNK